MIADNFGKKKIYYGSMKSGKSSSLAREVERFVDHKKKSEEDFEVLIFKPTLDKRTLDDGDSEAKISTRDGKSFDAIRIDKSCEILERIERSKKQFIGVDEVMFLDSGIIEVVKKLSRDSNKYLVLTGLDKNYRGEPFPFSDYRRDMYDLIDLFEPEERYKVYGWCDNCGRENVGEYTQRYLGKEKKKLSKYYDPLVVVGNEEYESRCEKCFEVPPGKSDWVFVLIMIKRKDRGEGIDFEKIKMGASEYGEIPERKFEKIIDRMEEEKLVERKNKKLYSTEIADRRIKKFFWR